MGFDSFKQMWICGQSEIPENKSKDRHDLAFGMPLGHFVFFAAKYCDGEDRFCPLVTN